MGGISNKPLDSDSKRERLVRVFGPSDDDDVFHLFFQKQQRQLQLNVCLPPQLNVCRTKVTSRTTASLTISPSCITGCLRTGQGGVVAVATRKSPKQQPRHRADCPHPKRRHIMHSHFFPTSDQLWSLQAPRCMRFILTSSTCRKLNLRFHFTFIVVLIFTYLQADVHLYDFCF